MDFVALLEQFGIPVVVALAFGFFIWKQNKFIQDELMEELDERFKRLEGIVIKLIDQQKLMQMQTQKSLVDQTGQIAGTPLMDPSKNPDLADQASAAAEGILGAASPEPPME